MNTDWMTELNVTEEELRSLQNNERAFMFLGPREREVIRRAKRYGCVHRIHTATGGFIDSETGLPDAGMTYRLHPDLELPKPDPHKPYLTTVDGVELWVCPVYVEDGLMQYYRPTWPKGHYVACAANFEDFRGVQTASYVQWDISSALHSHHRYNKKITCVYFAKEVGSEQAS